MFNPSTEGIRIVLNNIQINGDVERVGDYLQDDKTLGRESKTFKNLYTGKLA